MKAKDPEFYSGKMYGPFTGQPTVVCDTCGKDRNRLQVHRLEDGAHSCVFCIRKDLPPLTRTVVIWGPERAS
jgi:uncharacterized protein (DUF983 family)